MESGKTGLYGMVALVLGALVGFVAGCANSQKPASADLPPASPSAYPAGSEAPQTDYVVYDTAQSEPEAAPPAPSFAPFELRDGERLATYKAVSGDSLSRIASKFDTSVKRIQSANGLTNTVIFAGKTYKIPTRKSEEQIAAVNTLTPAPAPSSSSQVSRPSVPAYSPPQPSSAPAPVPDASGDVPSFAPRQFDYQGSNSQSASGGYGATPPIESASSITIPPSESSGGGSAFPTPTFGSGSSY